ncbi:MAG: ATP phosphoribosyltransferase [Alphaproteobacteria bacterium]|nr:ATP phosphoribosyltransferase [Alphaproteobacteria bacterium]
MTLTLTSPLILALPKGRIFDELAPLLEKIGIAPEADFFNEKSRALKFATNIAGLSIIRVRAFDVATFVAYGAAQMGVAGSDVIGEFNYPDLYAPLDLGIGRCRLSVAEPASVAAGDDPTRWSHVRIATKYPNLTGRYFAARGVQAECIHLNGAMELAPAIGLSERIVDLVSSGATLTANGLVEVEKIMDISSRLIVNRAAYKTRIGEIGPILDAFREALA